MKPIPYGRQNITQEDLEEVSRALQSDFLTQGPRVPAFEAAFAEYIGSKYAVAVANGTAALHLAAIVMGVQPGQKVITTPITFAASANCIRYCGGEVVFADIDHSTYLIDFEKVAGLIKSHPKGTFAGLILVDFAGRAVNLQQFKDLADQNGMWIIEDSCHAPGGFFIDNKGVPQNCGNGKFADAAIFSFHPVKHIACGEGGMITTNDENTYRRLLLLRSHGITREHDSFENSTVFANGLDPADGYPGWYMEMQELGFNYRLTDIQAALGLSQLKRADHGLEVRRRIAERYSKAFHGKTFVKGQSGIVDGHAYHLYVLEVENRLGLYNNLRANGVFPQIHYVPTHLMPYYRRYGWREGSLPMAEAYYRNCISLPMYPDLTLEEQEYVIRLIEDFFR